MSPFLVVPVILIALIAANNIGRGRLYKRIESLFLEGKPDEVLDYLHRNSVRYTFPRYNRLLLAYNAYLMKGDVKKAQETLEELLASRSSTAQRADLLTRAFDFYLSNGLYDEAHDVLEEIAKASDNPNFVSECNQAYEIVAQGSHAYIQQMEGELGGAAPMDRLRLLRLLAAQYDNANDKARAASYQEQARKLADSLHPGARGSGDQRG